MVRFLILYTILAISGLIALQSTLTDSLQTIVGIGLAKISWLIIHPFDATIMLQGAVLQHGTTDFALQIAQECTALPISWLLSAAIMVTNGSWQRRLFGIVIGSIAVQGLNLARIISLFYLGKWSREYFDVVHQDLWPLVLHLFAIMIFAWWQWHVVVSGGHAK